MLKNLGRLKKPLSCKIFFAFSEIFGLIVFMLSKSLRFSLVAGCVVMAFCALADDKEKTAVDPKLLPPPSAKQGVTYTADIQPIFVKSCYPCHGPKTPKPKGKLRLDTLEAVLKGGEDGPALVVGDSAKSVMVAQVSHLGDPDDYMPPPKNRGHIEPLTKEQIGLIRAWIDQGAK
jgi:hypothetical protein